MLKTLMLTLVFATAALYLSAQPAEDSSGISLMFIGDIMGHDPQIKAAENISNGTYDYDDVFRFINPLISGSDFAVANLEVTLAGKPYTGYPRFSSPAALAASCKKAGIDCLVTANNHSADRGNEGIKSTIFRLDSLQILHTGTFTSLSERDSLYPLLIERNNISVALLNYTYGTNGIQVPPPVIVNMLDKDQIASDIEKTKSLNPDIIILFLHWGAEYDTIPSGEQTALAEFFLSLGADVIIGSHPHVLQKMVMMSDEADSTEKPVIYSLGNFVSNQRRPKTDGGAIVRIDIARTASSVKVVSAGYYLTWVYIPTENGRRRYYILPCSDFENKPEFFTSHTDYESMMKFVKESRRLLNSQNINIKEIIFTAKTADLLH